MSERKGTKALELWCKRLVKDCPDVQIDNMTTSWRNGIAFCALVHHFRPDLIDMSSLHPENVYDNNKLAFSVAEKHLGIPSLLDPEDMVANEVPDRLSILTYLSQFYQRLGHTVNTKTTETDSKASSPSATQSLAPFKFGKAGLDKCAACGLPVYLAQRLIASHKLYHRRCFRCSKCSGHLNPKNFNTTDTSDFFCDSCKNEKTFSKFLNNNDQMGMLAFSDNLSDSTQDTKNDESISPITRSRPPSILEKISMFENNTDKSTSVENKVANLSLKENFNNKSNDLSSPCDVSRTSEIKTESFDKTANDLDGKSTFEQTSPTSQSVSSLEKNIPNKEYKTSINKFNFLQTQLQGDSEDTDIKLDCSNTDLSKHDKDVTDNNLEVNISPECGDINNSPSSKTNVEKNLTDDTRLAESQKETPLESNKVNIQGQGISVPPRRKKQNTTPEHVPDTKTLPKVNTCIKEDEYPDDLNPFSDSDDEHEVTTKPKKISTNPFGSSDEEDDDVPPIQLPPKVPTVQNTTPAKRHIIAYNPFWSDGEEPSSDDEQIDEKSMCSSPLTTSTPAGAGAGAGGARRKKARAPPPPAILLDSLLELPATSLDDVASISSLSSYNSTAHSDHKSFGKLTPHMKKKRLAPTPPDSISTVSNAGSMERGLDAAGIRNISDGNCRRVKGPAPGLPLPERREVKMMITPEELQVQLDLLETQQLGLERQGVLVEQMIRDKCEGDEPSTAPQEEVEDLVIQLCELVNEKNDLFRKQTELMYLRRQQRLEQEQADIEHEIRVIQSRPAVNRIDADKAREEQLVARLVQVVRLRDELVQQLDAERRRERQEDRAIAASIAAKRAQRNSESNSSSMKSVDVVATPKKSKVKDKVKKQLKKAKHTMTFISKKKEDSGDRKEEKSEKEKKTK